jgi:hypothetical protein
MRVPVVSAGVRVVQLEAKVLVPAGIQQRNSEWAEAWVRFLA